LYALRIPIQTIYFLSPTILYLTYLDILRLKNYLQNTLHWPEPLILREQPSGGKTLIEKFENFAGRVDCVFVLLTPDDVTRSNNPPDLRRSRQNVIFELGYFYAQLGRKSGRIIVLYKGEIELPSDIQGIVWIRIDEGVEGAGEEIRRETSQLLIGAAENTKR
jgi:predicted nucleotide-binding protein